MQQYTKELATRLLHAEWMPGWVGLDAEAWMLSCFVENCGIDYVTKASRMIADYKESAALTADLAHKHMSLRSSTPENIEADYYILTQYSWPPAISSNAVVDVACWTERFSKQISSLEAVYHRQHQGRKLVWEWELSSVVIRAVFGSTTCTMHASLAQADVLFVFQERNSAAFAELQQLLPSYPEKLLSSTLALLAAAKVLVKSGTEYIFNEDCPTAASGKLDLLFWKDVDAQHLEPAKTEDSTEPKDHVPVLQAAAVRIMKRLKSFAPAALHDATLAAVASKFAVTRDEVRGAVDLLIERGYFEYHSFEDLLSYIA